MIELLSLTEKPDWLKESLTDSTNSTISSNRMEQILERLKMNTTHKSTAKNYYAIWKSFNAFVLRLDKKPETWEQRLSLFGAYLVQTGAQSGTIRSYFSVIKKILKDDGYVLKVEQLQLSTLTKACKIINDHVTVRQPIGYKLLESILFEIERLFKGQIYLQVLYQTLFAIAFYGLFRIGELTESEHVVKAKDVSIGTNKNKVQFTLFSSKTHAQESKPQIVKISEISSKDSTKHFFCPFNLIKFYFKLRGPYKSDSEQFFIFRDGEPVKPLHARNTLASLLKRLNFSTERFTFHSFRSGRATMLLKLGYTIEQIKRFGHWRSNAVYRYLR